MARGTEAGLNRTASPYRPSGRERAGLTARQAAAALIDRVVNNGQSLDRLCDANDGLSRWRALIAKDRSLARAIATAALRHRRQIDCVLRQIADRPPPRGARHLAATLHAAAAQILYMDVPESAAVNLAVTSLREDRSSARFAGFGNAVLRRLAREGRALSAQCDSWELAFPSWLASRLRTDYGRERAETIARSVLAGGRLDLTLRPDIDPVQRRELIGALDGIELATGSVRIPHASPVRQLAGYEQGLWWVQDAAAALPALMLGDVAGLEVADLCAAPGGKTAQLAAAGASVTAVDRSAARLSTLRENLSRLRLKCELVEADVENWEPGRQFDRVLLDAPCSATGIMRRHPDVAWTRDEKAVAALAQLQECLLRRAIQLVRPGGILVYANCSLLKQEGEDLAARIAAAVDGLAISPLEPGELPGADAFINGQGALRTLPGDDPGGPGGIDGFFAVRFSVG
jgi:16S rRNA (cytosine967-C5)-methyltransferase